MSMLAPLFLVSVLLPTFSGDYSGRLGGAGNDGLQFAGTVTSTSPLLTVVQVTTVFSSPQLSLPSIIGGTGNDSLSFTSVANTTVTTNSGNTYFYESSGGTDTLFYTGNTTNTATFLTFNVLDSLYDSVATEVRGGTGINIVGTSGTTDTTIAYVLGLSQGSNVVAAEVSQSTIDSVSALG